MCLATNAHWMMHNSTPMPVVKEAVHSASAHADGGRSRSGVSWPSCLERASLSAGGDDR